MNEHPTERGVLVRIVVLALAVRAALFVIGLVSTSGQGPLSERVLELWARWDALNLLRVAEVGYRDLGEDALYIVFLPLFPAAVRAVALVFGNLILSGLIVSFVASVMAGWLLYRLVRLDATHAEAWRAVVLLFTFPTAYFLAVPYSEALFLALVLGSFYAARSRRWAVTGAAGAAATATRMAGIAVVPALMVEAVVAGARGRDLMRRLGWVSVVPVGLVAYLAVNWIVHRDALHFIDVQRTHWSNEATWPWVPLWTAVDGLRAGDVGVDMRIVYWGRIGATVFAVSLLAAGWRRLRVGDQVYGWVGLVAVLMSTWLISLPRYLLALYPLFVVLAWLTRRRRLYLTVVVVGAAVQGYLFWRYARLWWTF